MKTVSNPKPSNPEEALHELLALPLDERQDAVARDVKRRSPRYRDIPGHDLAAALGVDDSWSPGTDWLHIYYAEFVSVEEYAQRVSSASDVIYMIENLVDPRRFQHLLKLSEPLDETAEPVFSFLKKREREVLEHAIAKAVLEGHQENGICGIALYTLTSPSGDELKFEGDIEDDGACLDLRTPYDERAGRFRDLTKCLTSDWY